MILSLIKLRFRRGLSIRHVGPNEARVLFDAATGFVAALVAVAFCQYYFPPQPAQTQLTLILFLPSILVCSNYLLGIYSRLRLARARAKAVVLCGSVLITSVTAWLSIRSGPEVVLWSIMVCGPLVLARLVVSLHTGRHKTLTRLVVNRRGPILVIGGAGYIGSHTVSVLLDHGYDVRVLDRFMYNRETVGAFIGHPRFSLIEGDSTDIAKLTAAMRDCAAVVHLAGLVGDPACAVNPDFTRHANIITTRMAREVAEAMGIHRFIFASSCSVYGVSDKELSESDSLNPVSLYAQTKIDSERELLSSVRDEFFVTVLRFSTVFGHSRRARFDLVANLFTAQAMTDGLITVIGPNQWRPFVHVRDLARSVVAVLDADPRLVQSQVFNVGDKRLNMTILQLAERVREIASKHRPVEISVTENPEDLRNYRVSFEKIESYLAFRAETMLEEGIQEMVDHFLSNDYDHYRLPKYSNAAMTAKALQTFQDPTQMAHLYAPLGTR